MKKSFLPLSVLALLALAACGGNNPIPGASSHPTGISTPAATSQPATTSHPTGISTPAATSEEAGTSEAATSSEEVEYGVTIANKEILEEDWYLGDEDRRLSITLSPAANVQAALASGELVITSDNPTAISVTQLMIHAGAIGDAHITVTYHGKSDSIYLHVNEAIHGTKIDDPLTPAEAIAIAQQMEAGWTTSSVYYIKGYVTAVADPYSAAYSNITFYLGPSADSTQADSFYLYRIGATAELGAAIIKGAEVMVKCAITNYNGNTPENSGGTVISAEGGSAQVRPTGHGWEQNDPFTVAEALERCGGLTANVADEFDCYVKGTITEIEAKSGGTATFYIVDAVGGSAFYVYQLTAGEEDAAKILKGAEVVLNVTLKKYKSTSDPSKPEVLETTSGGKLISAEGGSSYVPKTGHGWEEGDPFTVAEAIAEDANPEQEAYVKGYVVGIKSAYSSQYGNISVMIADSADEEDATKQMQCFRTTVTKEVADQLVVGAQATFKGKIAEYQGAKQLGAGNVVVGDIVAPTVVPTAKTTIAELTKDGQEADIAEATVIAVNTKAIVIDDGTGSIYAYINAAPTVAVGDVVSVKGTTGNYKDVVQINNPVIAKLEDKSPSIPNPTVLTKEVADEFPNKKGYGVGEVYTWTTRVSEDGGYFYTPFEGSETKIELINPAAGAVTKDLKYNITGYFLGYDSRGWAGFVLISAEEVLEPRIEVSVDKETITVGEQAQLTIDMINFPEDGDHTTNVSITTEDESILEIDEINGTVTGLAEGKGTVEVVVTLDNDVFEQDIEIQVTAVATEKVEFDFSTLKGNDAWQQGGQDVVAERDAFGYTFNTINCKATDGYYMMYAKANSGKTLLANATPIPGAITKIEVFGTSSSSGSAEYVVKYDSLAAFDAPLTLDSEEKPTHKGKGDYSVEVGAEHDIRYFAVSCVTTGYNGQIAKVVITFVPDSTPAE